MNLIINQNIFGMKNQYFRKRFRDIILLLAMIISVLLFSNQTVYSQLTKPNETGPWEGMYVNTFTGNFYLENPVYIIPGNGFALDISFYYNSGRTKNDWGYGNGWSFSYNMLYSFTGNDIIIDIPDGQKLLYTWTGSYFAAPRGVYDSLYEYATDKFILQSKYGIRHYFDDASHGKLTKIEDLNGNTITLDYASGDPTQITDASGRIIELSWSNGRLDEITDPNTSPARSILLDYDAEGNLTDFGDPLGNYTYYDYGTHGNITGITDPRGNYVEIAYDVKGAVSGFTMPTDEDYKTLFMIP